jgi:two-component system, NtrC family, response regulator
MKRLLVIDDEPSHRLMVRAVMEAAGWRVSEAGSSEAGLAYLESDDADVVLLDMRMPGMDGREALTRLREIDSTLPVVMLTAFASVETAVEAMKRGAYDFLTKPADNDELVDVLEKALEYGRLLSGGTTSAVEDDAGRNWGIVGESQAMHRVLERIGQAGPSEATVLILGETGVGKELVAEALHRSGPRSKGPLIKVNCAALPAHLLESELFGYVKGAFTGAAKDKPGRFLLAQGGTLFLDEVGEMPPEIQAKLLRAIQERVVEPLGGVRSVPVDVRILAASNRELEAEVEAGRFREDLYFRLNVIEIVIPPLRERREDISLLTAGLLEKLSHRNRKSRPRLSPSFLEALGRHSWPGNVRELENVLERALILGRSDILGPELLPPGLGQDLGRAVGVLPDGGVVGKMEAKMETTMSQTALEEAEKQALVTTLGAHGGHRGRTAETLGISRRTLQYKLRRHGLTRQ